MTKDGLSIVRCASLCEVLEQAPGGLSRLLMTKVAGTRYDGTGDVCHSGLLESHDVAFEGTTPLHRSQDAIGVTLMALLSGFQERNADKLVGVYSADADWVNAFGSVKRGVDEIVEYLGAYLPTTTSTLAS